MRTKIYFMSRNVRSLITCEYSYSFSNREEKHIKRKIKVKFAKCSVAHRHLHEVKARYFTVCGKVVSFNSGVVNHII